jgi:Fe2+ transport system protein FeoA
MQALTSKVGDLQEFGRFMTLADLAHGQEAKVACLGSAGADQLRLRELGLGEGRLIRILSNNDPLICQVGNSRVGLCRRLAARIQVSGCE